MENHTKVPWIETPLIWSATLSERTGCNVLLKLENLQPSGSFKSRGMGAFMLAKLRQAASPAKVHFYSPSGGNAGLACVQVARTLGYEASVVVPLTTRQFMVDKLRQAGAHEVIQRGASWQEANEYLVENLIPSARDRGIEAIYVPAFDAPEIWDGYAAIPREIAQQVDDVARRYPVSLKHEGSQTNGEKSQNGDGRATGRVDAIICSVGGGGLFSGIMQGLDALDDEQRGHRPLVIATETRGADSLAQAVAKRQHVTLEAITSQATSLGARRVSARAYDYALRTAQVATVVMEDDDAVRACARFLDEERFLVELACGVCAAVCYEGRLAELVPRFGKDSVVVVVVCGGSNMSMRMMHEYMDGLPQRAQS